MTSPGIRVHVFDTKREKPVISGIYNDFPVRIGRDPLSTIPIDDPIVSTQHASLELAGGEVYVLDHGSRNGTSLGNGGGIAHAGKRYPLRATGHSFAIRHYAFTVSVVNGAMGAEHERPRGGELLSRAIGGASNPDVASESPVARAAAASLRAHHEALTSALESYRAAFIRTLESLDPAVRADFFRIVAKEHPSVANDPEFRTRAGRLGLSMYDLRARETIRVEEASHRVLQELAAWYQVPNPIATVREAVQFGRGLQDVCDALFSAVLPLRQGLKKFGVEAGVEHGGPTNDVARRVNAARNEKEVAAALLGGSNDHDEAWAAVRRICGDSLLHSIGMLHATMQGVRSLLQELSPAALTQQLEGAQAAGTARKSWFPLGDGQYRALWKLLEERYNDLTTEDNETFRRLFGKEFAAAYNQVFSSAAAEDANVAKGKDRHAHRVLAGASQVLERPSQPPPGDAPPQAAGPAGGTVIIPRRPTNPGET